MKENAKGFLYTPAGLPRPMTEDGRYPIPWNANGEKLGEISASRRRTTTKGTHCQTCGRQFPEGARGVLFIRDEARQFQTAEHGQKRGTLIAMDHGLLHLKCAKIALQFCPHLKMLRAQRTLAMFSVPARLGIRFDIRTAKWKPLPVTK